MLRFLPLTKSLQHFVSKSFRRQNVRAAPISFLIPVRLSFHNSTLFCRKTGTILPCYLPPAHKDVSAFSFGAEQFPHKEKTAGVCHGLIHYLMVIYIVCVGKSSSAVCPLMIARYSSSRVSSRPATISANGFRSPPTA